MIKQPIERHIITRKNNGKLIKIIVFKMDDQTYEAFAFKNFDTDEELVGVGEAVEKETAIKLAIHDLYIEIRKL